VFARLRAARGSAEPLALMRAARPPPPLPQCIMVSCYRPKLRLAAGLRLDGSPPTPDPRPPKPPSSRARPSRAPRRAQALFRKIAAALPGMESLSAAKQEDLVDVNLAPAAAKAGGASGASSCAC